MLVEARIDARRDVDTDDALDSRRLAQTAQAGGAKRVAVTLPAAPFTDVEQVVWVGESVEIGHRVSLPVRSRTP
jgi:hypothetical protein